MRKSHVYLGLIEIGGQFFFKIGKANDPKKRARTFATHLPGGFRSMYASEFPSEAKALAVEAVLISSFYRFGGAKPSGGEWFQLVSNDYLESVFAEFVKIAGDPVRVNLVSFGDAIFLK